MAMYTPEYQPNGSEIAVIKTSKGVIRVQLAGNDAPIHVGNFVELARKGFYDNLCLGPQHNLDSGYTVFGQTIEGKDVISELRVGDVIETVEIENAD